MSTWKKLEEKIANLEETETKLIQPITKDTEAFAEIKKKMDDFEKDVTRRRFEKLERNQALLLSRINSVLESQQATKEALIACTTALEEMIHGFEMLTESLEQPSKSSVQSKSIENVTKYALEGNVVPKKSDIN